MQGLSRSLGTVHTTLYHLAFREEGSPQASAGKCNELHTGNALREGFQRQTDLDLSVVAQLRAPREYADKDGYVVAREYVDEAESGRIADCPEFCKMIEADFIPNAPFREILLWGTVLSSNPT